jgi:hypothetical protein
LTDVQAAVDAKIQKKDNAKQSWKKKHNPRVCGGDDNRTHLPRHSSLKTLFWAVDEAWLKKLWSADREVEREYMTDGDADNEGSEGRREEGDGRNMDSADEL